MVFIIFKLGGLSSFSLFILILAFVKIHRLQNPIVNLGKLLFEFLFYYGNFFNFHYGIVDVNLDKYSIFLILALSLSLQIIWKTHH
jgi:hypothetical protein